MNSSAVHECLSHKLSISTENEKNPEKLFMLCALFRLHAAAKLKCHTNAYILYDVYVTDMFSFHHRLLHLVTWWLCIQWAKTRAIFVELKCLDYFHPKPSSASIFSGSIRNSTHFMDIKTKNKTPLKMFDVLKHTSLPHISAVFIESARCGN